jgi:multisubunit Na+/H+ antiporter MnhG subunit
MRQAVVDVLLAACVLLALLSAAGVALMGDALDRLHYAGPAVLGGVCASVAVVVAGGPSLIGTRAILVSALLLVTAPVLAHATARTIHREGDR